MQKTFILGVGAQKGGTTWLFEYLRAHPSTDMGFMKEYHVLDAVLSGNAELQQRYRDARISRFERPGASPGRQDQLIYRFLTNLDTYFNFFEFVAKRRPETALTGDITPSYCALPASAFRHVREELERRDLTPRVVFLMRDPVERCLSALRMYLRRAGTHIDAETETQELSKAFESEHYGIRTRYDHTIRNLEAAFAPEQLHFALYEEFFSEAEIRRLTDFLGIEYVAPELDRRFNESRRDAPVDAVLARRIRSHFADVYEFVAERFEHDRLARTWPHYATSTQSAQHY